MDQKRKIKIEEFFMNKIINANTDKDEVQDLVDNFLKENEDYTQEEVTNVLKGIE